MKFPVTAGMTEICFNRSRFQKRYLDYVGRKAESYFPPGFLKIVPLEPTTIDDRLIERHAAVSTLEELKNKKGLDIIAGLSSDIYYITSRSGHAEKLNEAHVDDGVVICGDRRPTKVTMPRTMAHELGHMFGLDDEEKILYRTFLTMANGYNLENTMSFAEKEGIVLKSKEKCSLMIGNLNYLEHDGFSKKDYAYLENLMNSPETF